jgi:hypothetical protein
VIPFFKIQTFGEYFSSLKKFAEREVGNGRQVLELYRKIEGLNSELIYNQLVRWRTIED